MLFPVVLTLLCSKATAQITDPSFFGYANVGTQHTCVESRPRLEIVHLRSDCGIILSPCHPGNYPIDVTEGFLMWSLNVSRPISALQLTFNVFETNSLGGILYMGRSVQHRNSNTALSITRDFRAFGSLSGVSPRSFTFMTLYGSTLTSSSQTYVIDDVEPFFLSFYSSLVQPFVGFNISYCVDVDQCRTGNVSGCLNGGFCERNSFNDYGCSCPRNYTGTLCQTDVDECAVGSHNCHPDANCSNTDGSFTCACKGGFSGNGTHCEDIIECEASNVCAPNSFCTNLPGSFLCTCNTGYSRNDGNNCTDINECDGPQPACDVNAQCTNTKGSFACSCNDGYRGDGRNCTGLFCSGNTAHTTLCAVSGFLEWPPFHNSTTSYQVNETVTWNINFTANPTVSGIRFTVISFDTEPDKDVLSFNKHVDYRVPGPGSQTVNLSGSLPKEHTLLVNDNQLYVHFVSDEVNTNTGFLLMYQEDTNACTSSPCLNGGVCSALFVGYTCTDCPGYTGQNCQTDIDECVNQVCHSLARCENIAGSFTCTCNVGFAGDGFICTDINECEDGTNNCDSVNGACENTDGSWSCSCNAGFAGDVTNCEDIDGCALQLHNCSENNVCRNAEGSFTCVCEVGYTGNPLNCTDINECDLNLHNCDNNAVCSNTPTGAFTCTCNSGFTGDGIHCGDVDECAQMQHDCHENASCMNAPGSFDCQCGAGYSGNGTFCEDINECSLMLHDCTENANCRNEPPGSFTCICNSGYTGNGRNCTDVDECSLGLDDCHANAKCSNEPEGTFTCTCNPGFAGSGRKCEDVNECNLRLDDCHDNAECVNEPMGSFTCTCTAGYTGNGKICENIDECELGLSDCHENATCVDLHSTFSCVCASGFSGNGTTCDDINECDLDLDNCHRNAVCTNTFGHFLCQCSRGYSGDGTHCEDIDECQLPDSSCHLRATCSNSLGSFQCTCNFGYSGNGMRCSEDLNCKTAVCREGTICQTAIPSGEQKEVVFCACTSPSCTAYCLARNITDPNGNVLQFPETLAGLEGYSENRCQYTNQPLAFIPCVNTTTFGLTYGLFDVNRLYVTPCTNTSVTQLLSTTNISAINITQLERILAKLDVMTADTTGLDTQETQKTVNFINDLNSKATVALTEFAYQRVVEIGDHVTQFLPAQSSNENPTLDNVSTFVRSLTDLGYRVSLQSGTSSLNVLTVGIAAKVMKTTNPTAPITYQPSLYDTDGQLQVPAAIIVPREAIALQMNGQNDTVTAVFFVHTSSKLFPSNESSSKNIVISAQVRGSTSGTEALNLQEPVLTTYREDTKQGINQNDSTLQAVFANHTCVFWNFTIGGWSTEGCFLLPETQPPQCRCNHLTNFALLVSVREIQAHISLQIVTYVCAALSILCLLVTFVLLIVLREMRKRRPVKILINICILLAIVYLIFITGADKREHESGCVAVAIMLHYFLLSVWGWMVVYAHFLYLAIIKVFHTWSSNYLKKAAALAYGIPAVIVAINAIAVEATKQTPMASPVYGRDPPSAFATSYLAENMCWIKGYSLYFAFLLPFFAMLLFNMVVFAMIIKELACKKRTEVEVRTTSSSAHHAKVAAMTGITLGLCWFFAFFMMLSDSQEYLTVMSWLFSVVVALQGVGIFLITVVRKNEVQIAVRTFLQQRGCPCGVPTRASATSQPSISQQHTGVAGGTLSTSN